MQLVSGCSSLVVAYAIPASWHCSSLGAASWHRSSFAAPYYWHMRACV